MEIQEQYEENGYLITKYANGIIEEELIVEEQEILQDVFENLPLPQNEFQRRVLLDIEYLKCLAEINGGI